MENNEEYQKWLDEVKKNGMELENVPEKYKTMEMCEMAVDYHGQFLEFVPLELRTKELCELAVSTSGWALEFVPIDMRTPELCEIAVKEDGLNLEFVPEELKTFEFCDMVVDSFIIKESEYADIVSKMILSGSHAIIPENLQNKIAKMIETTVPVEFQEEIAKKHDIELFAEKQKSDTRGR